ncbi:MAG: hypothetical protein HOP04_02290 [Methylophilaceae bacterium]|nr:hypothetical protein [Methylophilaceae bacterium]
MNASDSNNDHTKLSITDALDVFGESTIILGGYQNLLINQNGKETLDFLTRDQLQSLLEVIEEKIKKGMALLEMSRDNSHQERQSNHASLA